MSVDAVLKTAIQLRHCVDLLAGGQWREVCPFALGQKGGRRKVLAFQVEGGSNSGLASGGAWRCFALDDIVWARPAQGIWRIGANSVAKTEATLDTIECIAHPHPPPPGPTR
jgi:hypothetical protein